jgi:hypothetical protein
MSMFEVESSTNGHVHHLIVIDHKKRYQSVFHARLSQHICVFFFSLPLFDSHFSINASLCRPYVFDVCRHQSTYIYTHP